MPDKLLAFTTMVRLADAGQLLDEHTAAQQGIESVISTFGFRDKELAGIAASRTVLLIEAQKRGAGLEKEIQFVKSPPPAFHVLASAAWLEGFLVGLCDQHTSSGATQPLQPLQAPSVGTIQIGQACRAVDEGAQTEGVEEYLSASLGVSLTATFSFANRHAQRLLESTGTTNKNAKPSFNDLLLQGMIADGTIVGLQLRALDNAGTLDAGSIPPEEL